MDKIICFIATKQPAAAREFYESTLGLKFVSDDPFAIVFDADGTMLRVQKVPELNPAKHTVAGWAMADISARMKELIAKGVRFERFPGMPQDELGAWKSPAGATVAWFKDPDGNTLSLTQFE